MSPIVPWPRPWQELSAVSPAARGAEELQDSGCGDGRDQDLHPRGQAKRAVGGKLSSPSYLHIARMPGKSVSILQAER